MKSARNVFIIKHFSQILKEKNPSCQVENGFDKGVLKSSRKQNNYISYLNIKNNYTNFYMIKLII